MMRAMRSSQSTFVLLVVSAAACNPAPADGVSVSSTSEAIIQGDAVPDGELPSVIGLLTNAGSVCTGTLIAPKVVLTAAHCIEPNIIKQAIQAQGGTPPATITYQASFSHDLLSAVSGGGELVDIDSVEWHDQFLQDQDGLFARPGRWNDIGLVHLASPASGHTIQQLATADVMAALEMNGQNLVAGYGQSDEHDPLSAGTLKRGHSGVDELGDQELIAGIGDPQQACHGDSGGPIFADDSDTLQIGIASRINTDVLGGTSPTCTTGLLYTRIDTYLDWIGEKVPDLGQPPGGPGEEGGGGGDDDHWYGCTVSPGSGGGTASMLSVLLFGLALLHRRRRR